MSLEVKLHVDLYMHVEMLKHYLCIVLLFSGSVCASDISSRSKPPSGRLQVTSNYPIFLGGGNDGYTVVPPSASIELLCTHIGIPLPPNTILQWWEETQPASNSRKLIREIFSSNNCGVTLSLKNVSLSDYGRYTCKCVVNVKKMISQEGIQFLRPPMALNRDIGDHGITEKSITIIPSYDPSVLTSWAPVVSSRQYYQRLKVSLRCHPQHNVNHSALWTIAKRQNVRIFSHESTVLVTTSRTLTKYLCHSATASEVYSIHYLVQSEGRTVPSRAKVVYPPSNMSVVQILLGADVERSGIVNLCLIQPYAPGLTSSRVTFMDNQNNRTVSTSTSEVVLNTEEARTGTVTLGAQRIQEGLVYFVKMAHNRKNTIATLQSSVGEGIFTCSVNRRNKVTFQVNLTAENRQRHRDRPCFPVETGGALFRPNTSRSTRPPKPPITIDFTTHPTPIKLPKGTSSHIDTITSDKNANSTSWLVSVSAFNDKITISLLLVGGGVLLAVILLNALCVIKWYRKKYRQKMSVYNFWSNRKNASLQHSFTNSLVSTDELPQAALLQELQLNGLVYPINLLCLLDEVGTGAFGIVRRAHLLDPTTFTTTTVAVKMLKDSATTEDERDLLTELKTYSHIGKHPNVLSFVGATIDEGRIGLIVEYCDGGSLLDLLRTKRHDVETPLSLISVVEMASQIANGMIYLSSKKYIHRDLAARNVLVIGHYILKVADFGLAREVYHSMYRPTAKRLPIKWMAPEAIFDGVYTSKSDVWSFGILLWEMLTLGMAPYPGLQTHQVIGAVQSGYRMKKPRACSKELYNVMLCCWKMESLLRPNFGELKLLLDSMCTKQNYYNLRECHCSDSDIDQEYCTSKDYVNILPLGWFSSDDSIPEFLQGHVNGSVCCTGHVNGSVCWECGAHSYCTEEYSSSNSVRSLCSVCRQP